MLGVKLSEAQSYLIKSTDSVHLVICDGFNKAPPGVEPIPLSIDEPSSIKTSCQLPFPRVPPPAPPSRTLIPPITENSPRNGNQITNITTPNGSYLNGNQKENGCQETIDSIKAKQNLTPTPPKQLHGLSNSNCNYDNLRSIDSDESHLTTPEPPQPKNYFLPNGTTQNKNKTPNNTSSVTNSVQQQVTASLPLTDKNIMSSIMNKSSISDIKSQSMMTTQITPVAVKNTSDSVRSFKDKMKFFETQKEEVTTKR